MTRTRLSGKARAAAQAELERTVEAWNRDVPVGTEVIRTDDLGNKHRTRTRSVAWIICGHASVKVDGITGGYALERIQPVHPATARATGNRLDELARRAGMTIDTPPGDIVLRHAGGVLAGEIVFRVQRGTLDDERVTTAALRAAAAAALEVLAEHEP